MTDHPTVDEAHVHDAADLAAITPVPARGDMVSTAEASGLFSGHNPPATLEEVVFQAIGAASTCWESLSGTGVFDSDRAKALGEDVVAWIRERYHPTTPEPVGGLQACARCWNGAHNRCADQACQCAEAGHPLGVLLTGPPSEPVPVAHGATLFGHDVGDGLDAERQHAAAAISIVRMLLAEGWLKKLARSDSSHVLVMGSHTEPIDLDPIQAEALAILAPADDLGSS